MPANSRDKGFTLIELLIVIAIIGFLAAAILVAVDPVKRIQDSRDAQRYSEVNSILNAILKHQVDGRSVFAGGTTYPIITHTTNAQVITRSTSGNTACSTSLPTCAAITMDNSNATNCWAALEGATEATRIVPEYIAELPLDPATGTATNTGYYIHRTSGNRIEIGACDPEQASTIKVRR